MKEILNEKLGGDGGKVVVKAEEGLLKLEFSFPILKIVQPLATKLKDLVPGTKYDGYVDQLLEAGLKALGVALPEETEEEEQP